MSASTRARRLRAASLIGSALAGMVAVTARAQPVPFDGPSASMTCPPVLQSAPAQRVADGLVRRLEPQVATLGAASAVTVIGRELGGALRRELPSGEYLANQRLIGAVDRRTITLCFPRLGALIAEMERLGTDSSRYAAAQQRQREAEGAARAEADARRQQAAAEAQQAAALRRQQDIDAAAERDRQTERDRARREDARVAAQVAAAEQQAAEERRRRAAPVEVQRPLPDRSAASEEARRARDALLHPTGDEEARARADFFAHSVPVASPAATPHGEPNPWAEALKQLTTPPPDANQPGGQLVGAYQDYIFVRRCFDSRTGFALVYVTPEEVEAAKAQVKAIEEALLKQDPALDKNERWATANRLSEQIGRNLIVRMDPGQQAVKRGDYTAEGRAACRSTVTGLRERYEKIDPAAKNLRKDF